MYRKIVNPKTGKRVNLNGKIGKQILINYLNQIGGGCQECNRERGVGSKCRKKERDMGCEYINKANTEDKGVTQFGCYNCNNSKLSASNDDEYSNEEDSKSSSGKTCDEITNEWSTNANRSRDTTRSNRGEIDGNPFWTHSSDEETANSNMELQWYSGGDLSATKSREIRQKTLSKFNVNRNILTKLNSRDFIWINQGNVGGCSFASLSFLCQLGNIETPWSLSELSTEAGFRKVYINDYSCDDTGYNDWLPVIQADFCNKIPNMNIVLEKINYTEFKIRGSHNKTIAEMGTSKEDYGNLVFEYIKDKLDNGYAVAIPFLQHFITIIGHNDSQFLFLGSFGDKFDKGGLHIMDRSFEPMFVGDAIQSCIFARV